MKIACIFLFLLTTAFKSFAFVGSSVIDLDSNQLKPKLRHTIWLNIGQISRNEVQISYEHYLKPKLSLELSVGYKYAENKGKPFEIALPSILNLDIYDYAEQMPFSEGTMVALSIKGFSFGEKHPWFKSYLAPALFYRNRFYEHQWVESRTEKQDDRFDGRSLQSLDLHIYGFKLLAGHTIDMVVFNDQKKILLDLYYGFGYKYKKAKISYFRFNPADFGSASTTPAGEPTIDHIESKWPSLQGGIRLGFRF